MQHHIACACPDCMRPAAAKLTLREQMVLRMLGEGLDYQDIAPAAFVTWRSVQRITTEICEKLGAKNRVHAVAIFIAFDTERKLKEKASEA